MAKILIIEDDSRIAKIYQKFFNRENFEVEMANSGEAGLEKAKVLNPSLILLDMLMPKMNGLEVLDKLKENPETKDIPVMMLTNYTGGLDPSPALKKGAIKIIVKSDYEPQEIVTLVKETLGETAHGQNLNY